MENMKITKSKLGGTEMEHPSFGTLMFNRAHCGGKIALFGSSIMHNDIITMEISHAKMERDLNSDHFFGNNRIISIEMSYSQFAEAITSFGSYPGVPVTIKWTEKDGITPDCPYISKREQFTEELKEHREKVVKESKQLISDVARIFEKKNLTKSDKEEVLSKLSRLNSDLGGNLDFMSLIEAVASQDNETAKAYAKCIIANEKSEKNKQWCQKQQLKLNSTKGSFITLPLNISGMCDLVYNEMEFNIDRYYLREEEKELVDKILTRRKTCIKAQAMGVNMPNSTLLYGVPGCGKSLFANYISYITKTPLLTVRFSEMIDSRLGKTSNNIGKIFDFANKNDAIIFLDEIDTVARKRTSESGSDGELSRVTVTLMQELDKLKRGTIVIAATNRKDMLDEALFRRFSLIQEIDLPTKQDKINMVHKWWKSINMDIPFSAETYVDKFATLSDIDRDMVDVLAKMLDTEEVTVKEGKCLSNVNSWIKENTCITFTNQKEKKQNCLSTVIIML